ncbi:MAG: ABC transporter permease [Actinobacteria bacterium]|uniref:ABC transporter permease n=1 Tax=Microbacterium TaxID=33882 RepID=UPI000DFC25BB|nr:MULTISPECIES: ABC transporter permease subunit [Microbacterium]MEC8762884.1 ABC transporter permease subunit [Actinomycetota bacterium]RCL91205.1 MAG: ABC transporter permease subunit [Microbacterium sp.]MCC4266484.1 ABC transporter permease subunit [Microbacterium schleiferi]RUA26748.1 MAG: ABC transporter permease [Actinomycetota bacterium]HAJ18202.1 ABC transporter permease [Microbacterium sp.]
MSWVLENLGLILQLSVEHLRQCLIAILLGFVLSIPLGFLAWRFRLLRGAVVTITGLMYTIPSLALLFLLPALFGYVAFSDLNLILALTLYAIALLVRSVVDGLNSVDEGVRGASTAMGFSGARRFFAVELPLAGPVILAGLRVAAVSTIALAPVGILVGVSNLGYLFTNGLQRRIIPEVLAGVVAVVILALVIDLVLVLIGRILMPWTRRTRVRPRAASSAAPAEASA